MNTAPEARLAGSHDAILAAADHLLMSDQPLAALEAYQALALRNTHPLVQLRMGTALLKLRRATEAHAALSRAVSEAPSLPNARHYLAVSLSLLRRHDEAILLYEELLSQPDAAGDPSLHHHAAICWRDRGDLSRARALCATAMAMSPDNPKFRFSHGVIALMQGDWQTGWDHYTARWHGWDREIAEKRPATSLPLWQGEAVAQPASLVIHAEQGFGDCLQFSRYAIGMDAVFRRVRLVVPRALRGLLARSLGPGVEVRSKDEPDVCGDGEFTHHVMLMDLPRLLNRPAPDQSPCGGAPYLHPDPEQVSQWHGQLPARAPRVGFVWAGGSQTAVNGRDMPLDSLKPLLVLPDLHFISLQRELRLSGGTVIDPLANARSFDDTAALVAALDLVISVDTAVAHLAGALGKPVWLLNRFESEWRWGRGLTTTRWYASMRIFSQPRPGDWDAVVGEVVRCIQRGLPAV